MTEKAKSVLRKAQTCDIIAVAILFVVAGTAMFFCMKNYGSPLYMILIVFAYIILGRVIRRAISRKTVLRVILDDLDAPLFCEMMRAGKFGDRNLIHAVQSMHYAGDVAAAIELAEEARNDQKLLGRYSLHLLYTLAGCYFDIGDDANLSVVCRAFRAVKVSAAKRKRIEKVYTRIALYEAYLAGDTEACFALFSKAPDNAFYRIIRTYTEARIHLLKDEKDIAREKFTAVAAEAPDTVYAILASRGADAIDKGISYRDAVADLENGETPDFDQLIKNNKKHLVVDKIRFVVISILLAILLLSSLSLIVLQLRHEKQYNDLRARLEETYEEVELLDMFNLDYKGESIGGFFVFTSDETLMIGDLYSYVGDDEWYYSIQASARLDRNDNSGVLSAGWIINVEDTHLIEYCITYDSSLASDENLCVKVYEIGDKTVYFVVTEITEY